MLGDDTPSSECCYAQMGYERHRYACGTCIRYTWEYLVEDLDDPLQRQVFARGLVGTPEYLSVHTYSVNRYSEATYISSSMARRPTATRTTFVPSHPGRISAVIALSSSGK